jgi:hypothetical protein
MSHQYKYISGKELIARVSNSFTIDNSQWIYSAPLWIADGLAQLKIPMTLCYTTKSDTVTAYKCELPCDLKLLIAVEYNSTRLPRLGVFNNMNASNLADRGYNETEGYEVVGNNWITTTFEEGDIIFHYRSIPIEYDKVNDRVIPQIPDDAYVIEALQWFIILKLLYKGFKHPVFDLSTSNEFTNPGIQWEKNKKRARNSVNIIDADERNQISVLLRKFIQNYDSYNSKFFASIDTAGTIYAPLTLNTATTSVIGGISTITYSSAKKYTYYIVNKDTQYIAATTHGLGDSVIPVFYINVAGQYIKANTTFIVDNNGNITWTSPTVIADGLIVLI